MENIMEGEETPKEKLRESQGKPQENMRKSKEVLRRWIQAVFCVFFKIGI